MSVPEEIDGKSDREIAVLTYKKMCDVEETQSEIIERMDRAEKVTDFFHTIKDSTVRKTIFLLGWGVLAGIAYFVFRALKIAKKLKFG